MTTTQAAVRLVLLSAVFPLFVFPFAGRWDWLMAWAFVASLIIATLLSRVLAFKAHPDLLVERASSLGAADTKPWDRFCAPAMGLTPLFVMVVAGLDERFDWSPPLSVGLQIVGLVLVIAGYAFSTWAMVANRFFSGVVRIQTERDHQVVVGGPYAIVRHPGYAGSLLACIGMPLVLSSFWAVVPAMLVLLVTVVRTSLEDATLQSELPGYTEFTTRTRFRLLPGIW